MLTNNRKRWKKSLITAAVATVLSVTTASAEDINGSIDTNQVIDGSYSVEAVNVDTGARRTVSIDSEGNFRFPSMRVGSYKVIVSKDGGIVAEDTIRVALGSNASANFELDNDSNVVTIVGAAPSPVDLTNTDSGLVVGEFEFDKMPVTRSLTGVSLLAPGTVAGDRLFGGVSFGGSSVAENACFINGLEVTNTRQGLGCGSVPFEFYKEFQVKTGGYSPYFGRSTGGIMNAETKSGTNEWHFAATAIYNPKELFDGQISRADGNTGVAFRDTRNDSTNSSEFTLSAAGPIIEDKLFIYALINPRSNDSSFSRGGRSGRRATGVNAWRNTSSSGGDNLFWGAKIDWDISENHRLSVFGYSNRQDTDQENFLYDAETQVIGNSTGGSSTKRGGEAISASYTGYITEDLTVKALYGQIDTEFENVPGNLDCPSVSDSRDSVTAGTTAPIASCGPGGAFGANNDSNTQIRFDVEYVIGDHTIALGYDQQDRKSTRRSQPITGHNWSYLTLSTGGTLTNSSGVFYTNTTGAPQDYVDDRIFAGGGGFDSDLTALYLTDKWEVTDTLTLDIGFRQDDFTNTGTTGKVLTDFSTAIAPRLGFAWDPTGGGDSKIFGTWGKYYLPVANNTIFRAASGVSDVTTSYLFTGSDSTGAATGLTELGSQTNSVSVIPEQATFQSQEADPFSKVELIIGYQTILSENLSVQVRGISRDVDSALDDYCGNYSFPFCVLINPGSAQSWFHDGVYWDGTNFTTPPNGATTDGVPDLGSLTTYSAETIGLPEGKNEYTAIETSFAYSAENMRWNLIYTWSRSWGNFEGAVKSDIGQADAGITQDFDFPALTVGAEGYQPNDRRHVFKFYGSYDYNDALSVGWNTTLSSGRPLSVFGRAFPQADDPNLYGNYGDTFFTEDPVTGAFTLRPRGTAGRTPWLFKVDLNASYSWEMNGVDMRATFDVFNVLNNQEITAQDEHFESTSGVKNNFFGSTYAWQAPTSVRLGLEARF